MKYLLDTNICIYTIKKRPPQAYKRLGEQTLGDVGVSTITCCELEYGVAHSSDPQRNRMALHEFLAPLEVLDFTSEVAQIYGGVRTILTRAGTPIGPLDLMIAAHALYLNVTLVTNNVREFSRVPHLKIENWVASPR